MTPTAPGASSELEDGPVFSPRFSADGLMTCVTVDADDGAVLMVAHMNAEALEKTLSTGIVHYWSRSRGELWRKGDTSGQVQTLMEMRVDYGPGYRIYFVRRGYDVVILLCGGGKHTQRNDIERARVLAETL